MLATGKDFFSTPIEYLKGVGPKRGEVLRGELEIYTFNDLLNHFPFRYVDKSSYQKTSEIPGFDGAVLLRGTLLAVKESGIGRKKRLEAIFEDESGKVSLQWFRGVNWIKPKLVIGAKVSVYGKAKLYNRKYIIAHPELEPFGDENESGQGLQAVYHSGEKLSEMGLSSRGIGRLIQTLLPQIKHKVDEFLPAWLCSELNLMNREEAMLCVHDPETAEQAQRARLRLKFEELLLLQLEMLSRKVTAKKTIKGHPLTVVGEPFNLFYEKHLPFQLTEAQKRVVREIRKDLGSGEQMNRLLQGDVGSGKTIVALLSMLIAIGNGFQTCLMAPTEILANQHFATLSRLLAGMEMKPALLTGSTKKKNRKIIHQGLMDGSTKILVGTHALLEDEVKFMNLGLAVIDEQHRFGVAQRSSMWRKNVIPPHILVMTATPIPRTLALTFYGDLDVSVIDELPPGRKQIETKHFFESSRLKMFGLIKNEIAKGRQVYIVFPLIQESATLDYHNLMDGYEAITRSFPLPEYRVGIVHGQMPVDSKDFEMDHFVKGISNILVSTTVIEVGVDVPNASVMVIESAERFGLSQLHQLRGRVGRGAEQSWCILMTGNKLSKEAKVRMQTMCETNDGFKIAEVDLKLRGPGDIMGTQQSGILNLKIADLTRDAQLIILARAKASQVIDKDPDLSATENKKLRQVLSQKMKSKPNWIRIS